MFRHVGIVVNDIDKMLRFYQDILNLEIMYDKIESGVFLNHILNSNNLSPRIIKLGKNSDTIVELLYFGNNDLKSKNLFDNGYTHFAITVDSCDKLYDKIVSLNLEVVNLPLISQENKVKVFFAKDPENNIIEFVELL